MKRLLTYFTALAVTFASFSSCEDPFSEIDGKPGTGTQTPVDPDNPDQPDNPDNPGTPDTPPVVNPDENYVPDAASGIIVTPTKPDADGACTITLKALSTNEFQNYTGDVYLHIGIIIDNEWKFVESKWDVNDPKFKMESVGTGEWALEIPNIREFFTLAEPTTPIIRLGMVARSANEETLTNEKGETYQSKLQTRPDQFVSVTDTRNAYVPFQPGQIENASLPSGLKCGINYTGNNEVTLVFYDKDKNGRHYDYCYVVGEFNNWERKSEYAMKRDESAGVWWTTVTVDDPSKEYCFQYRMGKGEDEIRVQDPYSEIYYHGDDHWISSSTYPGLRSYPEGAQGWVSAFQINKPSYSWQHDNFKIEDEDDLVIYEMLLRDFSTTGDLNGAMAQLDYLADLGITAIELMPIQEFEGNDSWGYAPVGYFALDKAYGTREMYKKFIDECHARGIAVIIDVVYNHTTGSHPWARLYWNGSDNVSDNNPWYNVVTPHGFGVYQDLNHEVAMVKEHVNRSLVYLLEEYHVDGFRFDLTKGLTNQSGKDSAYDQSRVDILTGYYNTIKTANPNAVVILEHFVDDENYELGNRGMKVWRNMNNAYCQTAMGYQGESDFGGLADITYQWAAFGSYVGFMESHDEERMGYKQNAYGNIAGGSGSASTGGAGERWGIIGRGNDWNNDVFMTFVDGMYFADNVSFTDSDYFKFRKNASWDVNFGLATYGASATVGNYTVLVSNTNDGQDMKVPAGTYDVYFMPNPGVAWFMADGQKPTAFWGVVGTINNWSAPDIALNGNEDGFFVAEDVTFTATDKFKIRGGGTWDDRFNYGGATSGEKITINKAYTMTLGASSQDMTVAAGTYDIWFKPNSGTIWVMTDGQKPSEAGGSIDTGLPEDAHTVGMRRLGLNAAFFLTVPGPKMIWQFGEIGYDISIEDGGRTGRKPVKTTEYMNDAARKNLYNTYAGLLKFRKENPRFFDGDAGFRWYVTGNEWPGRYLFNSVDGKNIAIFGNFGSGSQTISVELPHDGNWYNYYDRSEVWSGKMHAPTLKEGEFIFLVDWK